MKRAPGTIHGTALAKWSGEGYIEYHNDSLEQGRLYMFKPLFFFILTLGLSTAGEPNALFRYLTCTVDADGMTTLKTAVKGFHHNRKHAPEVILVAASHVGDKSYYKSIQKRLNACDLVLYEGVAAPPYRKVLAKDCKDPLAWTRSALLYLRDMVVWYRDEMGAMPDSLRKLRFAVKIHNKKELAWVERASYNAWGKPVTVTLKNGTCYIQSLGRDGKPGGEGLDTDLTAKAAMETRRSDGGALQRRLAHALGLEFQMDVIDYSKPTFVNSDIGMEKLQRLMTGKPRGKVHAKRETPKVIQETSTVPATIPKKTNKSNNEISQLLAMMQGDNPAIEWLSSLAEGLLSRSEKGRETVKWVFCETLAAAEAMMEELVNAKSNTFSGTGKMMRILILDRNAIVIQDLKDVLRNRHDLRTVAIFYGAAHMGNLENRLTKELGYEVKSVEWLSAFKADRKKAGISNAQADAFRKAIAEQVKAIK